MMIRRLFFSLLLALLATMSVHAQNNPYAIDDECYKYMTAADRLLGKEGFEEQNEALLRTAVEKGDTKAQNIYYVMRLRNLTTNLDSDEQEVIAAFELQKQKSLELGYEQYFYQAFQSAKNFFFNTKKKIRALEIIQDMQREASERGSEYGMWTAEKELASFYTVYNARRAARKHLSALIRIFENSENATIRKQSISQEYLDYASTFTPEHDSVAIYVDKAMKYAKTSTDTVRCYRDYAKIAAIAGDRRTYQHYRDLCLNSPNFSSTGRYTKTLFEGIDALFDGSFNKKYEKDFVIPFEVVRIFGSVAETLGNHQAAQKAKEYSIFCLETDLSDLLDSNLAEMDARYGNDILTSELLKKSRQVERTTRLVLILIILLMLVVIFFLLQREGYQKRLIESERKKIEELEQANERVRLADETKTRFIQNMTHELRTPLNAIMGFSQLLAMPDGMFPSEEKEEFSTHIINNGKMLTMLLDDIMHTSAMDGGQYTVNITAAECGAICQEAMTASEHRLQSGVQLRFCPAMDLPFTIQTDPLRVQQILTNLLTNACKHTKSGEIRLGCSLDETPGLLTFSVEDTGPGIPPDQAERIFERFVKLDDFVQGTGLGLSISREIADKLGGRIWLDCSYSPGARFLFTIPLS